MKPHFENGIKIGSRWRKPFLKILKNGDFSNFFSGLDRFCKNCSGDHIHAPNFENWVYFFPQGTKLSAENVFRANSYG